MEEDKKKSWIRPGVRWNLYATVSDYEKDSRIRRVHLQVNTFKQVTLIISSLSYTSFNPDGPLSPQ